MYMIHLEEDLIVEQKATLKISFASSHVMELYKLITQQLYASKGSLSLVQPRPLSSSLSCRVCEGEK